MKRRERQSAATRRVPRGDAEQNEALSDILRVISSSAGNLETVFDIVLAHALRLCSGSVASLWQHEEQLLRFADSRLESGRSGTEAALARFRGSVRTPPNAGTVIALPVAKADKLYGVITVWRFEKRPFTARQVAMAEALAAQAAMAIENARLHNATKQALEHQTATSEILRVISRSPTDVQPVFKTIGESARLLCQADVSVISYFDGEWLQLAELHVAKEGAEAVRALFPMRTDAATVTARTFRERATVHLEDVLAERSYAAYKEIARIARWRGVLGVPMMREKQVAGVIFVGRERPGLFSDSQVALLKTFADQAVIAIENVRLFNETKEALERQTATADILGVISSSPTNIRPVLDAVAATAARLCEAKDAIIQLREGDVLRFVAHHGKLPNVGVGGTRALSRELVTGRAVLEGRQIHVHDLQAQANEYPRGSEIAREFGYRTILATPLMREGVAIGSIMIRRAEARPFTETQLAVMRTFADQAVIAIENARLFNETKEALDRQTATADILRVITGSPTDLGPVMAAVVENAARLADANHALVGQAEGDNIRWLAAYGCSVPEGLRRITRELPSGRAMLDLQSTQMEDVSRSTGDAALGRVARELGVRSIFATPLVREGRAIGVLLVRRTEVRAFSEKQVELLKTFADQAAIAIANVRLFNETNEALERQTATSEVLRVISTSPTDVQPVFDSIAERAAKLCSATIGVVSKFDGQLVHLVAFYGASAAAGEALRRIYPLKPGDETVTARAIRDRAPAQIPDVLADPRYVQKEASQQAGFRSIVAVPMVRDRQVVGAIAVTRAEPGVFPEKQVDLLKTFADQAVIAIENVRLFNETKEALAQQTAISEVLRVISSSPSNVTPVLEAVAQRAARICEADDVRVFVREGDGFRVAAGLGPLAVAPDTTVPVEGSIMGRVLREKAALQVDVAQAPEDEFPFARRMYREHGHRIVFAAPLLREDRVLGTILMRRTEARPFTEQQMSLLKTFADQAAIAIENVRLFNETKEALDQQKASAEVLGAISGSIADTRPVFEKILASCERLFEGELVGITLADGDTVRLAAYHGPRGEQLEKVYPLPLTRESGTGWAILNAQIAHFPDIEAEGVPPGVVAGCRTLKVRAIVFAPMLFEGKGIGAIWVARAQPGAFTDKQIAQLRTFADQAVIAIQNARLVNETKEALERQTATAEILKVIAGSPSNVQPVFDAIVASALRLMRGATAHVTRLEGDSLHLVAYSKTDAPGIEALKRVYPMAISGTLAADVLASREPLVVTDAENDERISEMIRAATRARGVRSFVVMPMVSKGVSVGTIVVNRKHAGAFTDHELDLLTTFADQAVIAIENVRLFNETKEALEQQKASGEVLSAISSSIADTRPVFDRILVSCQRLFAGKQVGINLVAEDGRVVIGAYEGPGREELERIGPFPPGESSGSGAAIAQRQVKHYPDAQNGADVPQITRRGCAAIGVKSAIFAPMLWEGQGIGVIFVGRDFMGPFSEKEIALLKTFADQAVIAIQNARLFREIQEKSAQLEVANKHKSDFLANMSHELRTPLNAIIGFSEVLIERMFGEVNEKQAEYLKDIHESGRHLLSLINDILDLSKIEAGRMELELSSFDLPSAVSNAMTLVRERAQRHGIQLGLDMDPRLGEFQADERKVKQILLNLLSNAVKFTPDGGRVDVSAKLDTDKVQIAVKDTGVGIAPEDHAAVFEEFKQVGRDYTRKAEGTGLGLALTKRLVELHGGEISLESTLGKGATFTVKLPLR